MFKPVSSEEALKFDEETRALFAFRPSKEIDTVMRFMEFRKMRNDLPRVAHAENNPTL